MYRDIMIGVRMIFLSKQKVMRKVHMSDKLLQFVP